MNKTFYLAIKNILDKIIAIILIIPAMLICIILGIYIKLDSKGPIFFKHKRIGKDGKTIFVYKLRTMVNGAEELKKNFTKAQQEEFEKNYKLKNDPRITKIGKKLRRLSLDELPQLINVIKGELSIVGPRPITKEELNLYGSHKKELLTTKPGIIGAWTANGRSNTTYEERIKLELDYIKNMKFTNDIKIIIKTLIAVIKRKGAV